MKTSELKIFGIPGLPIVKPGDNIPKLIVNRLKKCNESLEDGDIVIIAQSIVSKSIGRIKDLEKIKPSKKAYEIKNKMDEYLIKLKLPPKDPRLIQVIIDESKELIKVEHVLIVETKHGFICANAGVDHSNVEGKTNVTLLPENPDEEAFKIKNELKKITDKNVAVIISDSFGRPFRRGSVGVAIGVAGINPILDKRGSEDLFGKKLLTTIIGQADNLVSAAQLVMGEANEGLPVIIIRGYKFEFFENSTIKSIIREPEIDIFRRSDKKELLLEILKTRRSYKFPFSDRKVSKELILKCIEWATWAPSAHNSQCWRYLILEKNEIRKKLIDEMNRKLREDLQKDGKSLEFIEKKIQKTRKNFLDAPFLILLCLEKKDLELYLDEKRNKNEFLMGVQSVSASAMCFLLALEVNDLAACWYCAPLFAVEIIQEILDLPETCIPMAFFTVGYPSIPIKNPGRKELKDILLKGK